MKLITVSLAAFAVAISIGTSHTLAKADALPKADRPVVVELFTSEGCSDCPAADRLLAQLVKTQPYRGVKIIGLEEHIDYWNNRHWGDPFSSKTFTNRQYAYSNTFNDDSVYTPEMVVDGDAHFVGSDSDMAAAAITKAAAVPASQLTLTQSKSGTSDNVSITVSGKVPNETDLLVAVTEDDIWSHVADGENAGRTLSHGSVVRELQTIPIADSLERRTVNVSLPISSQWLTHPLSVVAFLQNRATLKITGSASAKI